MKAAITTLENSCVISTKSEHYTCPNPEILSPGERPTGTQARVHQKAYIQMLILASFVTTRNEEKENLCPLTAEQADCGIFINGTSCDEINELKLHAVLWMSLTDTSSTQRSLAKGTPSARIPSYKLQRQAELIDVIGFRLVATSGR